MNAARLIRTTTFNWDGTLKVIPWSNAEYDTKHFFNATNPSRLTIPDTGMYHITAGNISAFGGQDPRYIHIFKNGVSVCKKYIYHVQYEQIVWEGSLNKNDYIEIAQEANGVNANCFASANCQPFVAIRMLN